MVNILLPDALLGGKRMASEQEELENTVEAKIAQELREAAKESAAEGIGEVA